MWTRRCLILAWLVSAGSLLIACGSEDERKTPDCDASECFTEADGGTPLDGGSD